MKYLSTTYRSEVFLTPVTEGTTLYEDTTEIEAGHSVTIQLPVRLSTPHAKQDSTNSHHGNTQTITEAEEVTANKQQTNRIISQSKQRAVTKATDCTETNNNTEDEVRYIESIADRHLEWVAASNELDESEEEPRYGYPTQFTRRDSMDLLIEEAKQAYIQQSLHYLQTTNHTERSFADTLSDDSTQCSDTYSDESRSSCSTFDLSEQTEDSEPRLVIPKLYDREESFRLPSPDHQVVDIVETKSLERVPSFIQGHDDNHPLSAI